MSINDDIQQARSQWLAGNVEKALEIYKTKWESTNDCEAGEKLAFLYLQKSDQKSADAILQELKYQCRLAMHVINYNQQQQQNDNDMYANELIHVYDQFLSQQELNVLRQVFADTQSDYWTCQNYTVEPVPSPYCSYIIPLDDLEQFGILGNVISRIQETFGSSTFKPAVKNCRYVEMWAHNRPQCTGHQLHFDTDNEGRDELLKHPVMSTVLYLSDTGGPTLVTPQRRASKSLATYGYQSMPKYNRCVAFDGRVLHGVIPGLSSDSKGSNEQQRVSLMLAFWKNIRTRPRKAAPGAALPWPQGNSDSNSWARTLVQNIDCGTSSPKKATPDFVDGIYESTLDGSKCNRRTPMPEYDQVFQGF